MHLVNKIAALLLIPMFLLSSPALAQQIRIADSAAMERALATKADSEQGQRDAVRRVLDREDVRQMAGRMGLSLEDARAAVATLSGAELGTLAEHAGAIETAALVGGANTIVISVTTLLLILIIVILLVK